MVSELDLERIKELAQEATQGAWEPHVVYWNYDGELLVDFDHDRDFVAGISPTIVLALVAEIERLRGELEAYTSADVVVRAWHPIKNTSATPSGPSRIKGSEI